MVLRQIREADFVLMVCTETYLRRVERNETPGVGHGVMWEAHLIRQHLTMPAPSISKFVPVLFADGSHAHVPTPVRSATIYRVETEEGYEQLYRLLTGQHDTPTPPRGQIRVLPQRPRQAFLKADVAADGRTACLEATCLGTPGPGPASARRRSVCRARRGP